MAQAAGERRLSITLGFDPRAFRVGFLVYKVALGQVFLRELQIFPCQYRYTGASYSFFCHFSDT
jgi:hypothetical protein